MRQLFEKTNKQIEALDLLGSKARHILLYGGSRSGKTFIIIYALIWRALKLKSRHVILRKHFNHVKQSIWFDTLPKVLEMCFPGLGAKLKYDKSDWFIQFPNKSEIWFGGLDDKERTEKILGKEYTTIFFNECSEISWESRNIALTRLAEKNGLKNRVYYDCNPPRRSHWAYKVFVLKEEQDKAVQLKDAHRYGAMLLNPYDNVDNVDPDYISEILDKLPPLLRQRFRDGEWVSDESDIIRPEWLLDGKMPEPQDIAAKFSFCDPATTEKERANDNTCESAIVTLGVTYDGEIHDVEVLHGMWSYGRLKEILSSVHERHKGAPSYFIGAEEVAAQRWLIEDLGKMGISCMGLKPDNDKVRRAISVTDVLETGKCHVHDTYLRNQLLGFPGEKLKDLVDAYVYALKMFKMAGEEHYKRIISKFDGLTEAQVRRKKHKLNELRLYGGQSEDEIEWEEGEDWAEFDEISI